MKLEGTQQKGGGPGSWKTVYKKHRQQTTLLSGSDEAGKCVDLLAWISGYEYNPHSVSWLGQRL